MSIWIIVLLVFLLGAIGGLLNSLVSKKIFEFPKVENGGLSLGCFQYAVLGGIVAVVVWCMYGPLAQVDIYGSSISNSSVQVTLSQLIISVVIGFGEAKALESQLKLSSLELQFGDLSNDK